MQPIRVAITDTTFQGTTFTLFVRVRTRGSTHRPIRNPHWAPVQTEKFATSKASKGGNWRTMYVHTFPRVWRFLELCGELPGVLCKTLGYWTSGLYLFVTAGL
ncbi:hypothetical protein BDV28DRAFT_77402 [Aspergillus coremiiformis]|uniref:Uncharacterized protein n=1 Tax=Aspergillus coremiiformis TaxID=138285 RepID=A0A5N6YTK0_9EURO|nr:hypothetical protein BDV28DRAFT_77402 [Aspergillus coremiiformis]